MQHKPKVCLDKIPTQFGKIQSHGSYIQDLRYISGYYTGWVPEEFGDEITQEQGYEILKKDEKIFECLDLLSLFGAGEKTRIKTTNALYADLASKCLEQISRPLHARKTSIYNSHLYGLSLQKVYWEGRTLAGYPGVWQCPVKIVEIDKRRLRIERNQDDRTIAYWTVWSPYEDRYVVILDRNEYPNYEGPMLQDYLWNFFEYEELEPYYRSLGQVLFRLAYMKSHVIQYWGDLCESWSRPWMTVESDVSKGSLDAGETGFGFEGWEQRADELIRVLEKQKARHILVTDKDADKLQIHEHGSVGNNIQQQFLEYADEKIQKIILASELTTGTGSGAGSFNMASIHRESQEAKAMYARSGIEEMYSAQLLNEFFYRNERNLNKMAIKKPRLNEVKAEFYIEVEELREEYLRQGLSESRKDRSQANL